MAKSNPNEVWGPNQNYADRVSLAGTEQYHIAPGGNVVDRNRINKTLNVLDKNMSQPHPLGQNGTTGF